MKFFFLFMLLFSLHACKDRNTAYNNKVDKESDYETSDKKNVSKEVLPKEKKVEKLPKELKKPPISKASPSPSNQEFQEITHDNGFSIDIKYATANNFTKKQIYPCGRCFLRPDAASKLAKANEMLQRRYNGLHLKMFDCYRPRPAQQRLWDVVPNPDYVTPPNKGSMHNRGLAVDLTIEDESGKELNMGTPYDFFGVEAHMDYTKHSEAINKNRAILKSVMLEAGFSGIRTEWWHYSIKSSAALADWEWPCK